MQMMNLNSMPNMNSLMNKSNMQYNNAFFQSMMEQNKMPNSELTNHLNEFDKVKENNPNIRTVKLFFEGEFIQNVEIGKDDSNEAIKSKFKSIIISKVFPFKINIFKKYKFSLFIQKLCEI